MLYCTCIIHILYMYCPYTVHVLCTYCACMLLLNKTLTDAGTRCWQAREVLLCPSGSYLPQQQCYSAPSDIQVGNMSTGTRWSEYSSEFASFYCQKLRYSLVDQTTVVLFLIILPLWISQLQLVQNCVARVVTRSPCFLVLIL